MVFSPGKRDALKKIANYSSAVWISGAFLSASGALVACTQQKLQYKGIDVTGIDYAQGFSLPDQFGKTRSLADFAGKVVVVFFGYTQCPDVCPTTMADMAQAKKLMGADGDKLQVIFVTVDPERDTAEVLKAYMANFDPSFLALRPDIAQLPDVAKAFKVYYKKVDGPTPTSYTMDHSAGSFVYDSKGKVRLFLRYGGTPQDIAFDLKQLLRDA